MLYIIYMKVPGISVYGITHTSNLNGIHGICNNNAPWWADFKVMMSKILCFGIIHFTLLYSHKIQFLIFRVWNNFDESTKSAFSIVYKK